MPAANFELGCDDAGPGDDDDSFTFDTGEFGNKTIAETVPTGWSLESATCTGATDTDPALTASPSTSSPATTSPAPSPTSKDATVDVVKRPAPRLTRSSDQRRR